MGDSKKSNKVVQYHVWEKKKSQRLYVISFEKIRRNDQQSIEPKK